MKRWFIHILFVALALVFAGCRGADSIVNTPNDLNGLHLAVLDATVSDESLESQYPDSDISHFKSSSEFLLALSIGKCDAGFVKSSQGEVLLSKLSDFAALAQDDEDMIIVHRRMLADGEVVAEGNLIGRSIDRIERNIISDGYWLLILRGLATTLVMFIMGITLAMVLAILMLGMNSHPRLRLISQPISYFIKTIHDVPSVVLIFFFYYFVFATASISGIIVCAIALGVYSSGSLMTIFSVHLNQVDKKQHKAAQMLGLTGWNKYRYVILPQAVKPMLPLIGAETKGLLRATTYAGYISEIDLVKVAEIIRNQTYDVLVPLLFVSAVFLMLSKVIVEGLSVIYAKVFKYD